MAEKVHEAQYSLITGFSDDWVNNSYYPVRAWVIWRMFHGNILYLCLNEVMNLVPLCLSYSHIFSILNGEYDYL